MGSQNTPRKSLLPRSIHQRAKDSEHLACADRKMGSRDRIHNEAIETDFFVTYFDVR
jgi:hypothetical protein